MRVVLDSSVLIAASISRAGVCSELLEDVLTHHEFVASRLILNELTRKLREKFRFPTAEIRELRSFFEGIATLVQPEALPADVCRNPNDIPVLGTAAASAASVLVTLDKDLLALGQFRSIAIINPGAFWRRTTG